MSASRIVIAQFCDDVRHETGNKYSLMGCYGDELIIDKLPAALSKLCAQIRAITPIDRPFIKLIFRAFLLDDCIAEIDMPISESTTHSSRPGVSYMGVMAIMAFSPLVILEPCHLRIEAETEDGILHGSRLFIRERTSEDSPLL